MMFNIRCRLAQNNMHAGHHISQMSMMNKIKKENENLMLNWMMLNMDHDPALT